MCPIVSIPVMLGGGIAIVYGFFVLSISELKIPLSFQYLYHLSSTSEGLYALGISEKLFADIYYSFSEKFVCKYKEIWVVRIRRLNADDTDLRDYR